MISINDEDGISMEGTAAQIVNDCLNILINTKYFMINAEQSKEAKEYLDNKFRTEAIKILACNSNKTLEAIGFGIDPDTVSWESEDIIED